MDLFSFSSRRVCFGKDSHVAIRPGTKWLSPSWQKRIGYIWSETCVDPNLLAWHVLPFTRSSRTLYGVAFRRSTKTSLTRSNDELFKSSAIRSFPLTRFDRSYLSILREFRLHHCSCLWECTWSRSNSAEFGCLGCLDSQNISGDTYESLFDIHRGSRVLQLVY